MLSVINLPGTKAFWDSDTILGNILFSLFVKTFESNCR